MRSFLLLDSSLIVVSWNPTLRVLKWAKFSLFTCGNSDCKRLTGPKVGLSTFSAILSLVDIILELTGSRKAPFGFLGCLARSEDSVWFKEIHFQLALGLHSHEKQTKKEHLAYDYS